MKKYSYRSFVLCLILLLAAVGGVGWAQQPPPQQQPVDASGKWTIYSKGPTGKTSTKTVEIKQNGNVLSGHFKGPNQSGGIEGTINEHHIVFRTKTRYVLTFRGRVDGDAIHGTFHDREGTGEWQATRTN